MGEHLERSPSREEISWRGTNVMRSGSVGKLALVFQRLASRAFELRRADEVIESIMTVFFEMQCAVVLVAFRSVETSFTARVFTCHWQCSLVTLSRSQPCCLLGAEAWKFFAKKRIES